MSKHSSDYVYTEIFNDIRLHRIVPNTILLEEDLAARFKLSRTPIREAILRLVHDGLLERRGSSTSVRLLTIEEVANFYPLIGVMEGLAARLAAQRITAYQIETLEDLHQKMCDSEEDSINFIQLNSLFHKIIIEAAQNPSLAKEIERFRIITGHFRLVILEIPQRRPQSVKEHATILHALKTKDAEAAEAAMRLHVKTAEDILMVVLHASQMLAPTVASPITDTGAPPPRVSKKSKTTKIKRILR